MLSNYFANEYTFEFPFEQFVEEEDWFSDMLPPLKS